MGQALTSQHSRGTPLKRGWRPLLMALVWCGSLPALAADYTTLPGGTLASVLANDADKEPVSMASFSMRTTPVTQAEFLKFVQANPEWRRGTIARTFADSGYLKDWSAAQCQLVCRPGLL